MLYNEEQVHALLPQKTPFAFVDEILELNEGDQPSIVAVWHVKGTEPFFAGHFPGNPVLPGVIQIESMAQAATLLTMIAKKADVEGKRPAFMGVESCRFRAPVIPPQDLTVKVSLLMARHGIYKYSGEIWQGETFICNANFSAAMV
jgi:3-hydroxyacyl-[acyl-carrier-protein] dehydratase